MTIHFERRGAVALLTIDNPPVNALNTPSRARLLELVGETEADPQVRAVVLLGAGRLFVGGADLTEFDRPPQTPTLPELIAAVEAARKPWIAVLHGVALGGGLELALGCHYRLATPEAQLGLPEVSLGIIPGAGGTQRLPRLIGVEAALAMIARDHRPDGRAAAALGLVDAVIEGAPAPSAAAEGTAADGAPADGARAANPLAEQALAFATTILDQPLPPVARTPPDPGAAFWAEAEAGLRKAAKGARAPLEALAALRHGLAHGLTAGLARERETFLRLKTSEEAAALRYLFFAERAALRPAGLKGIAPLPLARVGVVGAGTMGTGIAAALRGAGLPVVLAERDAEGLARGLAALDGIFAAAVKRGLISAEQAAERRAGVTGCTGLDGLADCDLVIEAVFEDLAVKQQVFAELARLCHPQAILATNTSYIDPRRIAAGIPGPERVIGLHFFSPAQVMRLLEIIPLPETAPQVAATALALARRLGKVPVRAGICEGFIGNRILKRTRAEAEAMLAEGVPYPAIDAALRAFGYPMGPFQMQDLAGLDISYLNREAARARGEDLPTAPGDLLVRAGRKGQKTGGGWYDYAPGSRAPLPSPEAERLIAPLLGPRRDLPEAAIQSRILTAMAAEGAAILAEGIAATPADIDLVQVHGYGFPRTRGGPMFQTQRRTQA